MFARANSKTDLLIQRRLLSGLGMAKRNPKENNELTIGGLAKSSNSLYKFVKRFTHYR